MERLIHDLLDFSRVDARGTEYFVRLSCDDVLNDAIQNIHSLIEENEAVVTRDTLPVLMGDPVQLTRVFQNLLSNSIRYRSEAAPEIHIGADSRHGEWVISVRDNGIGIEPQYSEKIFGIFKCLHSGISTRGVAWGWRSAEDRGRHDGRIWVSISSGRHFPLLGAENVSEIAKGLTMLQNMWGRLLSAKGFSSAIPPVLDILTTTFLCRSSQPWPHRVLEDIVVDSLEFVGIAHERS